MPIYVEIIKYPRKGTFKYYMGIYKDITSMFTSCWESNLTAEEIGQMMGGN